LNKQKYKLHLSYWGRKSRTGTFVSTLVTKGWKGEEKLQTDTEKTLDCRILMQKHTVEQEA